MAEIKGADLLAKSLKEQGVEHMFGVVGFPVGPIADAAQKVDKAAGAKCKIIDGDKMLEKNYPTIHSVCRASTRASTNKRSDSRLRYLVTSAPTLSASARAHTRRSARRAMARAR